MKQWQSFRSHAIIQRLGEVREVLPNRVSQSSWDYKRLAALGSEAASARTAPAVPALEIYHGSDAYCFEDSDAAALCSDLLRAALVSCDLVSDRHRLSPPFQLRKVDPFPPD